MNPSSPVSRRCKTLLVRLSIVVPLLVVAAAPAPPQATSFADSMLNKLTLGQGDPTLGPYPEEGFLSGGRTALATYQREVIGAMGSSADVYISKLNEFAPQRYFNNLEPNRARDHWVRDFNRLKELAGAS
jgi:hypothetical protein